MSTSRKLRATDATAADVKQRAIMEWSAARLEHILVLFEDDLGPRYLWRLRSAIKLLRGKAKHGRRG